MMFSPEFRLLLLACRIADAGAVADEAGRIIGENRIGWDDLYKRAGFHRVEPQLSALLAKVSPSAGVPEGITEELRSSVQANLVGQIRYVAEFFRIREWLSNDKITVVPYKGFWLGESAYGNLADRVSSDIDLFIDLRDLEKIKTIMKSKGYAGHESLEELTDEYINSELAEYNFDRYEEGVCQAHVEFHWRSAMSFYRMGITLEDLRSQIITGVLQGRGIDVFSPAANLLLVVVHHGGKEGYVQLRQILDIAHIIDRYPDLNWKWLFQQAERFHVTTLLLLGVRLAHEVAGVDVPSGFGDLLAERCGGKMTGARQNGAMAHRSIDKLAAGKLRQMTMPVDEMAAYKDKLCSWTFKIRSRDGMGTKARLFMYTLRKILAPRLVPEGLRHHFYNQRIRRSTGA